MTVSPERKVTLLDEIVQGSVPRPIYYLMLGLSALIAGFGLLADSPAVVIGAMLVSPLMMPIFGVSVALSRGDLALLRNALLSEFGGVALVIALSFLLGMLPLAMAETPEMFARTSPTLMDLFVAVLAGLAGCFAMIDERISPALPGVAIATALTPPLATSGLCLALGSYSGAWGAFLLFFANFLAILAVATLVFIRAGFVGRDEVGTTGDLVRRFLAAGVGLLVVTVLLTQQLIHIVQDRRTSQAIHSVLEHELEDEPNATVLNVLHDRRNGRLEVLAVLRTANVLSPRVVQTVEEALSHRLEEPVTLFFRCALTKDVGATGSASLFSQPSLDGGFRGATVSPEARMLQVAEQVIRDRFVDLPNFMLNDVSLVRMPIGPVILASIQSPHDVSTIGIKAVEDEIRNRLGDPNVWLLARTVLASDTSGRGRVLLGRAHFDVLSEKEAAQAAEIEAKARAGIEAIPNLFAPNVDAVKDRNRWIVRAEVLGPEVPRPAQVQVIERELAKLAGEPVVMTLWARTDMIVTAEGYNTADRLIAQRAERQLDAEKKAAPGAEPIPEGD